MSINNFIKSNTAISFGYFAIAAFLILGTSIWIMFIIVFNNLFNNYNILLTEGTVTIQNNNAMNFHQKIILFVPIVLILGLTAWGFIRALEHREEQ